MRYGGGLGVGARLLSPTRSVRATLGVALGALGRRERYFRVASAVSTVSSPVGPTVQIPDARADSSKSDADTSALLLIDAGILFGSTPGLKFHFGALLAATFGSSSEVPGRHGSLGRDGSGAPLPYGTGALSISSGSAALLRSYLGGAVRSLKTARASTPKQRRYVGAIDHLGSTGEKTSTFLRSVRDVDLSCDGVRGGTMIAVGSWPNAASGEKAPRDVRRYASRRRQIRKSSSW